MRSFGFTVILALLAVLFCGLAGWQWIRGNFNSLLGAPPVALGQAIYSGFKPSDVKHIEVTRNGITAKFDLTDNGWMGTLPWKDRMDPRAAVSIINFTLGMRVEDFAARDEIVSQKAGLGDSAVDIWLEDKNKQPLASYKIGRQTPWLATVKDIDQPIPTVFIHPRDDGRKRFIYAATGDIAPLFKDGLKYLRDHRPFYFNPVSLQKIRIRAEQGELTITRETPKSSWRVVKPLELATEPKAMKALLEGLYELQATKILDRATASLPTKSATAKSWQIALSSFGNEQETMLEIYPSETPEALDVLASVNNRPDSIFVLPQKPAPSVVSLADLPLAVNDLRDQTLTNLNIQSLRGILIQPVTGNEILISRTPPHSWKTTIAGQSNEANEERLFALLKAVTEGQVIGFETDAATDFTPWGLNRPFLKIRFFGKDDQGLELEFGMDEKGGYFVNRVGTSTVMRINPSLITSISVRAHEWKPARLWSLDRVNLMQIDRTISAEPLLALRYEFNTEEWTANQAGKDLTQSIDPPRANFLLGVLEELKVTRWLASDDDSANHALLTPSLRIKVYEKNTNDLGDFVGIVTHEITVAPSTTGLNARFYYGRLDSYPHPFLMDRDTYNKLATDVFDGTTKNP